MKIYPDMNLNIAVRKVYELNKEKKNFVIAIRKCKQGTLENSGNSSVAYCTHPASELVMPEGFENDINLISCKVYGGDRFIVRIKDITKDKPCIDWVQPEDKRRKPEQVQAAINLDNVIAPGMNSEKIKEAVARAKETKIESSSKSSVGAAQR